MPFFFTGFSIRLGTTVSSNLIAISMYLKSFDFLIKSDVTGKRSLVGQCHPRNAARDGLAAPGNEAVGKVTPAASHYKDLYIECEMGYLFCVATFTDL